jgi:putative salt-induced outer membrane protein
MWKIALLAFGLSLSAMAETIATLEPRATSESEAGVVVTGGNTSTETFNFKQSNSYPWGLNVLKFNGKYLSTSSKDVSTARNWILALRYERELTQHVSVYLGQSVEADVFAGFTQRYNTDLGGKYYIIKETALYWDVEGGYRYSIENRLFNQAKQHYLRVYTEALRDWSKTFSTRVNLEYLPNLTESSDYQLNSELAASAAINETFAIKVSYLVKYRHLPPPPATETTDTQFTTSLVAKL